MDNKLDDQFLIIQASLDGNNEKTRNRYYEFTNIKYDITNMKSNCTEMKTMLKHMMVQN